MAKKAVKKAKKPTKKTATRTNPVTERRRLARQRRRRRYRPYRPAEFYVRNPTPRPSPLDEMMPVIKMVMEETSMHEDKAKKTLECAELLEKTDPEFAKKLREKAKELLRPKLEGVAEEVKPAIRHLDLD